MPPRARLGPPRAVAQNADLEQDAAALDPSLQIGERTQETEAKDRTYHRVERSHGQFRRVIALPADVERDAIEATYREGVLNIRLPKAEAVLPKKIEVKASN